ncbi:MAG: hypothetical protein Q4G26_10450, partial [Paracoccus sp. (in: a-proteobacteria)]|nr:hypothetical protein [Paracoccus sp. (in: a-proteobacteria)]
MRRIMHNSTAIAACLSLLTPHLAMAQDTPVEAPTVETCADGSAPPCAEAPAATEPPEQAAEPAPDVAEPAPTEAAEPQAEPAPEVAEPVETAPPEPLTEAPAAEAAEETPAAEAPADAPA